LEKVSLNAGHSDTHIHARAFTRTNMPCKPDKTCSSWCCHARYNVR